MRSAWLAISRRKRSRATASSRAGPCSVSTKARSEASGVRSSWLALAMKSARICTSLSCSVRSRKVTSSCGEDGAVDLPSRDTVADDAPLHRHALDQLHVDALLRGERAIDRAR